MVKWRKMEKELNIEPLIRLKELDKPLTIPEKQDEQAVGKWLQKLKDRSSELTRITRAEHRAHIFEASEERKKWRETYIDGKVKGLVAKVMDKMNGTHGIHNVWLPHETGLRLSVRRAPGLPLGRTKVARRSQKTCDDLLRGFGVLSPLFL